MSLFSRSILVITLMLTASSRVKAENQPSWGLSATDLISGDQPQATLEARERQKKETLSWLRPDRYDLQLNPLTDSSEKFWREVLWAIALQGALDPKIEETLSQIIALAVTSESTPNEPIVKRALQVATGIYLANETEPSTILKERFLQIIEKSPDPRWVAMALSALVTKEPRSNNVSDWLNTVNLRFPKPQNTLLETTLKDIQAQIDYITIPPLTDLLNWQIAPNQAQIYVFCRPDRRLLCLAVLKDQTGRFVYQRKDLWSLPLLTRSLHGLRSQFEYGQSPSGIYRIEGIMPRSESTYFRAYGQFPLVKVFLPSESGSQTLPNQLNKYQTLLPPSWRGYFPTEQTFWAGQLGRGLIRIHGTGEGLDFFASASDRVDSYGWNPALGCLSAAEVYDQNGRLEKADMPKVLRAISQAASGRIEGYMILVEIPSETKKPVTVEEIQSLIQDSADNSQIIKVEPNQ